MEVLSLSNLSKEDKKMMIAKDISYLATCPKAHVGCYIEDKYGKSVSMGYNGAPAGFEHCDVAGCQEIDGHCTNAVHSEINGILNGEIERMRDGTMYLHGAFPCYRCAQAIVTVKFKYLYCTESFQDIALSDLTDDQSRSLDIILGGELSINSL